MTNRKTDEADHNHAPMAAILSAFRARRMELVDRLDNPEQSKRSQGRIIRGFYVPMRLDDMLFFQAEHDDYHLARISELIKLFR